MNLTIQQVPSLEAATWLQIHMPFKYWTDAKRDRFAAVMGCRCFKVCDGARLVGYYALMVDTIHNARAWVVAAAGRANGPDLTATILPLIERQVAPAKVLEIHTRRPGLIEKLSALGWSFVYREGRFAIMEKELSHV